MTEQQMASLTRQIEERCAFSHPHSTPDHAAADELRAVLNRDAVSATPAQREQLERLVRRRTGV
jgi:hypothetical protein